MDLRLLLQLPALARLSPLLALAIGWSGPATAQSMTPGERDAAVAEVGTLMTENYVFPDKGEECRDALAEALEDGSFEGIGNAPELAQRLTRLLQELTGDLHLRVGPRPPGDPLPYSADDEAEDPDERLARMRHKGRAKNFGFEQILRLPGNIGYIDLRGFEPASVGGDTAIGAMNFLGNSDALIFDLRQNGGGDPDMVQLISTYLFDEPTHLNSLYWRKGDETTEFWTLDDAPGPRMPDVPVYVLTSSNTFSAAEEFTYNLQTRERATVVGETTGGGAHPGGQFPVGEQLMIFISLGRAINPITGTNWEGTGVTPDVAVPSADAMDKAIALATVTAREHRDRLDAP